MPRVVAKDAVFSFFGGRVVHIPDIDLQFERILVVKGRIGSGKTLLLKALGGAIEPSSGIVALDATPYFIHSQPEFNFVTGSIGTELDFIGISRDKFAKYADREAFELSGGELKRLSVQIAMEAATGAILMDEPLDMLDDDEGAKMVDYIVAGAAKKPIIIATHSDSFDKYADKVLNIAPSSEETVHFAPSRKIGETVLLTDNICVKVPLHWRGVTEGDGVVSRPKISLDLHKGEIVCLFGANGSGKSLFVRTIAGIGRFPYTGSYEWHDKHGVCLQFPEHIIYQSTVAEEIADVVGKDRVDEVLAALNWEDRANISPFTLSDGEKRKMYIVAILIKSDLCVFDEPFAGLDDGTANFIINSFIKARDGGKAILYTANRRQDTQYADKIVGINP